MRYLNYYNDRSEMGSELYDYKPSVSYVKIDNTVIYDTPVEISESLKSKLVGVWMADGKSNNDSDRDIIKNLVDPDNPFVISNAAYKLNSGYGLYGMDFLEWKSNSGMSFTSTKLTSTKPNLSGGWLTFRNVSGLIPETKVKVSGAPREFGFIANNNGTDDKFSVTINNGVYTIPEFTLSSASGFYINNNSGDWSNLVIEQIPSYQGAFVTDGVDDMITSTKTVQEMLGGSNEITVVSMIHQINGNTVYTHGYTNYIRHSGGYLRNLVSGENGRGFNKTGIYGYTSTNLNSPNKDLGNIVNNILGDKNDYSFERGSTYTLDDAKYSVQNFINAGNQPSNESSSVAWYWTFIAKEVLTTDEINEIIAYYDLDRHIRPLAYYNPNRQGINNSNHNEFDDKLIDLTGNGYDIKLYNLAWKGGSGISSKEYETIKDFKEYDDSEYQEVIIHDEFSYTVKSKLANRYWAIQANVYSDESKEITIITDKDCEWVCSSPLFNSEGIQENSLIKKQVVLANTPTKVKIAGKGYFEVPEGYTTYSAASHAELPYSNGEITVTIIPSCKDSIIFDGIDDYGEATEVPILKDYTVISDYCRLTFPNYHGAVAKKGAFTFNRSSASNISSESFGIDNQNVIVKDNTKLVRYQSKYMNNGNQIQAGNDLDDNILYIGKNDLAFMSMALSSFLLYPYSLSEFLINRQLKKYNLKSLS